MAQVMTDLNRIKSVLVRNNLEDADAIFEPKKCETQEEFQAFADRLSNDVPFKELFVSTPWLDNLL